MCSVDCSKELTIFAHANCHNIHNVRDTEKLLLYVHCIYIYVYICICICIRIYIYVLQVENFTVSNAIMLYKTFEGEAFFSNGVRNPNFQNF